MTAIAEMPHASHRNMLWLELTNFCNLKCSHCYNSSSPEEDLEPSIDRDKYLSILDDAKRMNFRCVQFIGGEPFFYPHIWPLVDRAVECEFEFVEIFSNLTVLPRRILDEKYRGISLATSFYSDDPEVHDKITGRAGSFDRTVASIRRVCAAGLSLRAAFIEMERNNGHYDRVKGLLSGLGVNNLGFDRARRFGRAETDSPAGIDQLCGKCSNGNLSIDTNGDVSACIMSKAWKFGNVRHDSLDTIFHSPGRRSFADQLEVSVSECYPYSCEPHTGRCIPCSPSGCLPNCAPTCLPECMPGSKR